MQYHADLVRKPRFQEKPRTDFGARWEMAQYNLINLPTQLSTSAGVRSFAYIYGQGKYSLGIATASPNPIEETRHYLGGMEFKNGAPEAYNFSDGRIVYEQGQVPRPQFRLADHLGNTVVFFEDKNQDHASVVASGCVTTTQNSCGRLRRHRRPGGTGDTSTVLVILSPDFQSGQAYSVWPCPA